MDQLLFGFYRTTTLAVSAANIDYFIPQLLLLFQCRPWKPDHGQSISSSNTADLHAPSSSKAVAHTTIKENFFLIFQLHNKLY